jgi:hypothetical protein
MQQRIEEPAYAYNCSQSILASGYLGLLSGRYAPFICLAGSSQSELKRTLKRTAANGRTRKTGRECSLFERLFGAHGERSVSIVAMNMVSKVSTPENTWAKSADSRNTPTSIENLRQPKRFEFYANCTGRKNLGFTRPC